MATAIRLLIGWSEQSFNQQQRWRCTEGATLRWYRSRWRWGEREGSNKYGIAETQGERETYEQQTNTLPPDPHLFHTPPPPFSPPLPPSCKQFSSLVLPLLILYGLTLLSLARSLPLHHTPGPQHGPGSRSRRWRRRRRQRRSRVKNLSNITTSE